MMVVGSKSLSKSLGMLSGGTMDSTGTNATVSKTVAIMARFELVFVWCSDHERLQLMNFSYQGLWNGPSLDWDSR
jgi:hypothetical protein